MTVPRSVAEVLTGHVTLEVEGIDRMYLNVYVPGCSGNRVWPAIFASIAAVLGLAECEREVGHGAALEGGAESFSDVVGRAHSGGAELLIGGASLLSLCDHAFRTVLAAKGSLAPRPKADAPLTAPGRSGRPVSDARERGLLAWGVSPGVSPGR